jgi:hypothetical protein
VFGKTLELEMVDNKIIALSTKMAMKHYGHRPQEKFDLKISFNMQA